MAVMLVIQAVNTVSPIYITGSLHVNAFEASGSFTFPNYEVFFLSLPDILTHTRTVTRSIAFLLPLSCSYL